MTEIDPSIQITPQLDISIDELTELQAADFSVMRSAHVGNLSPYNLTLAAADIPILAVDHNITGTDTNYTPELVVKGGESIAEIAPIGRLSCKTLNNSFGDTDVYIDQYHLGSASIALPESNIFANSEYLRANEAIAADVVAATREVAPQSFSRIVNADGTVSKDPQAEQLISTLGIMQLQDDYRAEQRGVLMPNCTDIVTNFVIEALTTERDTIYHLSGPDMIRYIGSLQEEIDSIYAALVRKHPYNDLLPTTLVVQLVPTTDARFAVGIDQQENLDELLERYDDLVSSNQVSQQAKKAFFASDESQDQELRQQVIDMANTEKMRLEIRVMDALESLPSLLDDPRDGFQTSQYDILDAGGLYVAKQNTSANMDELAVMTRALRAIKKRYA